MTTFYCCSRIMQRNEGQWDLSMEESIDGQCVVLEVDVGKYLDTSLIKADIQPGHIRHVCHL